MKELVDTGRARYVARHYAFLAPVSTRAAEASECAAEQGKFWEYRDLLFASQGQVRASDGWDLFKSLSARIGLDQARFSSCVESGRYGGIVREESNEAERIGVPGTPAIYVDGEIVKATSGGIPSLEDVKAAIEQVEAKKGQQR